MTGYPRPDSTSVYHENHANGHATAPETDAPYRLDPSSRPRPFALIAAPDLDDNRNEGDNKDGGGSADNHNGKEDPSVPYAVSQEDLCYEPVVMWGQEHETATATHGRDPATGRWVFGTFRSAEAARSHYSRWGTLRLAYT